ncbi:MAG: putative bifunctional diguanylate cyclase/phosphodiesterase [Cellulomonas sp.]
MTRSAHQESFWRRRGAAILVSVVVTTMLGILGLAVQSSVLLGQMTADLAVAQPRATGLSNTQRECLRLLQALTDLGDGTTSTAVAVQRGLLGRQINISIPTFPAGSAEATELIGIQTSLAGFPWDRLDQPTALTEVTRRGGMELVKQTERRVKALYDKQEKFYYAATVHSIEAKHRSETALVVLVVLALTLGGTWVVMLQHRTRNDVARAYEALVEEVKERQSLQDVLAHQAAHDPLTELANRTSLLELLSAALHRGQRAESLVGVLFIDLDHFKAVNDTLGHRAGDDVLRVAAARMRDLVRAGDTVGRLGGDEFVIVVEPLNNPGDLVELAARVIAILSEPMPIGDRTVVIGASVGIAVNPDGATDANQLLHHADVAAYRAKAAGRGRAEVFDEALRRELDGRADLEAAIVTGLAGGEFLLHYQPVVELSSGAVSGYEALIRWQRPGHGLVAPDTFIPTAEQSNLICEIDRWVLAEALHQLARWMRVDPKITMAVNISGRHLASVSIVADVARALRRADVSAAHLILEITETVLVNEPASTARLRALRELGVGISIDDFGTGYTSIGQLQHLHADILKIDRSFIGSPTPGAHALVELMINAAHSFGLRVVAEGVERADQLTPLIEMTCDSAQGYYLARPQPAAAFSPAASTLSASLSDLQR